MAAFMLLASIHLRLARNSFWKTAYTFLANSFGVLLEQPPYVLLIVNLNSTLKHCFALTIGLWALVSIILTNAYKGLVVSELARPVPARGRWTSVSEMEGFRLYTVQLVAVQESMESDGRP